MSDLPNEKITESSENDKMKENSSTEEFSTIFSDPAEHKKASKKKGGRKRITSFVAAVLAVAVLTGGTIAVVKLIPKKEDDSSSSTEDTSIRVLNNNSDDFKTITVSNDNGTFKLYSEKTINTDTASSSLSTSSSNDTVINWYLDGYDKSVVSTYSLSSVAKNAAVISASQEITEKTASDCGLDQPKITIDVVTNDDAEYQIFVGAESPDKSGYYLKVSTADNIYLVSSNLYDKFNFTLLSMANTDSLPGITVTPAISAYSDGNGKLTSCDSLSVSGKNFPQPLLFKPNTDNTLGQYANYIIAEPTLRVADNVDGVFNLFVSGITTSGAYSMDIEPATLKNLGLDDPDMAVSIKVGDITETFKFKQQSDGDYAVIYQGSKQVKKVSASSLSFIDYKASDFYSSYVNMVALSEISNFTVKDADVEYSFDVYCARDDNDNDTFTIECGGKVLETKYFQNFYQQIMALKSSDYNISTVTGDPDLTMTFNYSDASRAPRVVTFTKVSETKYQYKVDGVDMGCITSSSYDKVMKYAEKVAAGKDIN